MISSRLRVKPAPRPARTAYTPGCTFFFFNDTATTEIYTTYDTLSLHDALPISEYLGLPQLTHLRKVSVEGGKVTGERESDDGVFTVEAPLPAVVSVNEKINEPRFPSFKGIMAAKKKEVTTLTLAEMRVEADEVGVANAGSKVTASTPKPPKTAGEKVTDEGDGGTKVAEYLVAQKII